MNTASGTQYARDLALFSLPIWKDQKLLAFTWNGWLYTCTGLFEASLPSVLCRNIYSDKIWVVWTSYTTSHWSGGWARSGVHAGGTGKTQAWQSMSVTVGDNLGTSRNIKCLVIQVGQGKMKTSLRQITASYLSAWKKETDSTSRNVFQPRYWVTSESLCSEWRLKQEVRAAIQATLLLGSDDLANPMLLEVLVLEKDPA